MEMDHVRLFVLMCVKIVMCVQAQVTFNPDPEEDVQLQPAVLNPPVNITTIQCYLSSPKFTVQYVNENEAVYDLSYYGTDDFTGQPINASACGNSRGKYRIVLNHLRFIADPVLVGGTFRLKATLDNNEENSTMSRRTYTFPAPFNLSRSSVSTVLNSEFTWTCHVTSDYPIIEWFRGKTNLGQLGILNGICSSYGQNDTYTYNCQQSALTYTLTIPGPDLTEELQGSTWRCKDVNSEVNGSKFMKLDIVVPVTSVTISPGSGSTLNADENQTITFTCTTNDANPPPTILWYIGSSEVTSQAGPNRTNLTLNFTRAEHQMPVECVAWNSGNTANLTDSTTLHVRFPPANNEKLQITGYTSGQVLYENQAIISIYCTQPGGNPLANMTLTCGSGTTTNESTATEAILRVDLKNDRNLNGKNCICESTHINGYMRNQSFSFIVYYPPGTPTVSISSPFPWKANESQNLTCNTTSGNPRGTTYIWKEGESELSTTSPTYIINPLQSSDNGRTLHCQVNNNFTLHENTVLTSANTTLQVLYPPGNDQELQIMGYASGDVLYENNPAMISISCTQPGGNPVANMTFGCRSQTVTIEDTTKEAIRRLNLTNDRNLNGQNCTCVSTHINGYRRSKSLSVIVYYPPSTPTIETNSSFPWKAPGTYILTCNTNPGNPAATTYIWKEGGYVLLTTSNTYEFNPLKSTDDKRQLQCKVENNFTVIKNVSLISNITDLQVEYDPIVTLEASSVEVIEGQIAVLRCSATGNPAPTVTWYRDSTPVPGSAISSSNYSIVDVNRTATGNYICEGRSSSTGSNVLQADQKTAHLRVFYPPTVSLLFQNTTENAPNHTIRCTAAGDPNNSTIVALQQRIGSTLIRNITSYTESSPGEITLTILTVAYQDMGTYTCLASNGIPDRSSEMIQSDTAYLNVITSAKFEMLEYIVRSDIGTSATISIPFYINPPADAGDMVWINNTGTSNDTLESSSNVSLSLSDADVNRTFNGVDVTLHGQSANMDIPTFQDFYEGNYTLKIRSSHTYSVEVRIALIRSGPPDTPSSFRLLTRKVTSVVLMWNKGSDGGHPQTFVILYKEKTSDIYKREELVDTSTNRNITYEIKSLKPHTNYEFFLYSFNEKGNSTGYKTLDGKTLKEKTADVYTKEELDDRTTNRNITYEIKSLKPGTNYEFLLYSLNKKGNSTGFKIIEERTLKAPVTSIPDSLNSGLVGGAVGGGAAVLVVVIVIIVIMRRRLERDTETHIYQNQDRSFYTDLQFDRPTTNGEEERAAYTMLQFGQQHTYSNIDNVQGAEGGQ